MLVDWDNLQSLPMSDREARALGELIDYIDEFSMLHGRAKGKLRELVIELVSAQFEATEPLSDIAIDAETLRVVREIHMMVSECSGHIGRMANPTATEAASEPTEVGWSVAPDHALERRMFNTQSEALAFAAMRKSEGARVPFITDVNTGENLAKD